MQDGKNIMYDVNVIQDTTKSVTLLQWQENLQENTKIFVENSYSYINGLIQ